MKLQTLSHARIWLSTFSCRFVQGFFSAFPTYFVPYSHGVVYTLRNQRLIRSNPKTGIRFFFFCAKVPLWDENVYYCRTFAIILCVFFPRELCGVVPVCLLTRVPIIVALYLLEHAPVKWHIVRLARDVIKSLCCVKRRVYSGFGDVREVMPREMKLEYKSVGNSQPEPVILCFIRYCVLMPAICP